MYTRHDKFLLLTSLQNDGSTDFVQEKLTRGTVGHLCYQLLKEGYIIEDNNGLILTEVGNLFLRETNYQLNKHGVDKCISSLPDAYIERISINDVYLPKKI